MLLAAAVHAQEFRATLQGTVTDPSQATVPGATVLIRNVETGIERTMETDEAGHYLFPFVQPGNYTVTVKMRGFKTTVRESVGLSLNDNLRLDIELALGEAAETVSVVGDIATVQAESSSLGAVVSRQIVDTLPLKGHSSLFMYNLVPGVVGQRFFEDVRPSDTGSNVLFTANGAPMASGDIAVDGVANTANVGRGLSLSPWVPPTDAVAEFKMQMGTLAAEYGRSGGTFSNIVIKSGSNALHGSLYEYFRNSVLDANQFFPRGRGIPLTPYGVNVYGGSVGGPVFFPKLYDGRNRTFFFFNYEGSHEGQGQGPTLSMPTAKMRGGDFSEVTAPIYDPFSVRTISGVPTRDPFPGNIIPTAKLDPVARNITKYWPTANRPSPNAATPWVQNFTQNSKWPTSRNGIVMKFDHQLSSKHQTFARYNDGEAFFNFNYNFDGIATQGRNVVRRPFWGIAVNDTYLISPRTTLDTRIGYTTGGEKQRPYSYPFDLASLGFPASFVSSVQANAFPTIRITGIEGLAGSGYREQIGHTYSLQSSVSMQRGKHLFKTGGEGRLIRGNFLTNNNPSGNFSYAQGSTGGPRADTPVASSGFAMASFMLGYGSGFIDYETGVSVQNVYYGFYLQDDYRVTPRLTLNMGLRYEYESPRTERYDRTTRGFAYGVASPLKVPGYNLTGGLIYANVGGQPRGIYEPDRNNFAPRFGFAYNASRKTVIRGGYALSYIPIVGSVFAIGYSNQTPLIQTQDGITPKDLLRNPFPNGLLPPIGNSQGLATLIGFGISFTEPADRVPMFHNWQFNIQREIAPRTMVEIAYVGSRAIKVAAAPNDFVGAINENINQVDPKYLSMGTDLLRVVDNPFFGYITGSSALAGRTVQQSQLLRPYPQYTGVTRNAPAYGNTVYHSMQLKLEKRFSHGLTALVSYTFSKNIGDLNNPQNAYDRSKERAPTEFDAPQRLSVSGAWQLPFGKGRSFFRDVNRGADMLIGGWTLSTFMTFQEGFPTVFGMSRAAAGSGSGRPMVIGDPSAGVTGSINSRLDKYFNTSAFAQTPDFTYGNVAPRIGSVRNPGMNSINLTLGKDFKITETAKVEFRTSAFNLLNHPVFSGPSTTFGDASFGRISNQANLPRQMEFALKVVF
jgi:hypothetical protein